MKIFLSGQKQFGRATLELLLSSPFREQCDIEVVGVAAPPPDADGRADRLWAAAELRHIPCQPSNRLSEGSLPTGVDLIVCAHSHAFIGRKTRYKASLGAIGFHPSLLPLHRGRDAVRWTIKMRDRVTGGTVFWLDDKVDGGPIAAQDYCFVRPEWSASDLWRHELFPLGLRLLKQVIWEICAGRIVRIPQDEELATWEPALDPPRLTRPDLLQLSDGSDTTRFIVERDAYRNYSPHWPLLRP